MPTIKVKAQESLVWMNRGSDFADLCTPTVLRGLQAVPKEHQQAYFDGFLSRIVFGMGVTLGQKATQECCEFLVERAQHVQAEIEAAKKIKPS